MYNLMSHTCGHYPDHEQKEGCPKYSGQVEQPARVMSNGFQACKIQKSHPGQGENSQERVL